MLKEASKPIVLKEYIRKYTALPSLALTRLFDPTLSERLRNIARARRGSLHSDRKNVRVRETSLTCKLEFERPAQKELTGLP